MKKIGLLLLILMIQNCKAQVTFSLQTLIGHSISTKNLVPFKMATGFGPGLTLGNSEQFAVKISGEFLYMQPKYSLTEKQSSRTISLGLLWSPIKEKPQFTIELHGLRGRLLVSQNPDALPTSWNIVKTSTWDQWGYRVNAAYNIKEWLAITVGYSRFCQSKFDPNNFQSIITIGMNFQVTL